MFVPKEEEVTEELGGGSQDVELQVCSVVKCRGMHGEEHLAFIAQLTNACGILVGKSERKFLFEGTAHR